LLGPILNGIASVDPALGVNLRPFGSVALAVLALGVGWALWKTSRLRGPDERRDELENIAYAVALSAFVLLVPMTWVRYYAWTLIGAVLLLALVIRDLAYATSPRQRRRLILLLCGVIIGVLLINTPLPFGLDTDPAAMTPAAWGVSARWILEELRPLGALLLLEVGLYWLLFGSYLPAHAPRAAADVNQPVSSAPSRSPSLSR
jgi:hypothetical protein